MCSMWSRYPPIIRCAAPNLLATPHLGYVTADNYRTYFREAIEDIAAFLAGTPVRRLA